MLKRDCANLEEENIDFKEFIGKKLILVEGRRRKRKKRMITKESVEFWQNEMEILGRHNKTYSMCKFSLNVNESVT